METTVSQGAMTIYKPYKLNGLESDVSCSVSGEKFKEEPIEKSDDVPSHMPTPGLVQKAAAHPIVLPNPPPPAFYLYQLSSHPPTNSPLVSLLPPPLPNSLPPSAVQTYLSKPPTKRPREIHEYFDQPAFQWREFNPEDTVIGDQSDPFIVYFRYASKSIGARRTPWILPKHVKLVKIMQDCLPDFDWRTGEDILVRSFILEYADFRLKRGFYIFELKH